MIEDSYALTPMQQGMLFNTLLDPGCGVDVTQVQVTVREPLDVSSFGAAWQRVVDRHPALRTAFRWERLEAPVQDVHGDARILLAYQDWRALTADQQQGEFERFLKADRLAPFDMAIAPLHRLTVFALDDASYQFVWTIHHALIDGRSAYLVLNEVFTTYDASRRGETVPLPEPVPFRRFVEWLERQDPSRWETFWRSALDGVSPAVPIALFPPAVPIARTDRFGHQQIVLTVNLVSALGDQAGRHDVTLNTLVQGAWGVLLSRYRGEPDVVFGAMRACRHGSVKGAQDIVGLLVNALPVRCRVRGDAQLLPWLRSLREQAVNVRPFEHASLLDIQQWSGLSAGTQLFDTTIALENQVLNLTTSGACGTRALRFLHQPSYPLSVSIHLDPDQRYVVDAFYDRRSFDDASVRRLLSQFRLLLEQLSRGLDRRLCELSLLSEVERQTIAADWNATRTGEVDRRCVHQLFEGQVEKRPDACAVTMGDEHLSYRALSDRVNQLATRLRHMGVGPEVRVAIYMHRCPQLVVSLLAVMKAGGAYIPMDPAYPRERNRFIVDDSQAAVLLTQETLLDEAASVLGTQARAVCVGADSGDGLSTPPAPCGVDVAPDNLAYVMYTSGSTGVPKGVMISHRGLVNYLDWCAGEYAIASGRGAPTHTSIAFDLTITSLLAPLAVGNNVLLLSEGRGVEPLATALCETGNLSLVKLTPAHLELLSQDVPAGKMDSSTRVLVIGGEALTFEQVAPWREHSPHTRIINEYGPTEAVVGCCTYEIAAAPAARGAVPIGRPIANVQIYLLDQDRELVPVGIAGELHIGGIGVARGYLNRPDLTAERFIPDAFTREPGARLYASGDQARHRADGNIEFIGRRDQQVKIRGYRVELGEVEAVLAGHASVRSAVVMVQKDDPGATRLTAYVVPKGLVVPSQEDLRRFAMIRLPEYMVPSTFVLLTQFPLTCNGKVDRSALPAPGLSQRGDTTSPVGPRTPLERALVEIWRDLLKVDQVGIHDSFFALGGHSLLALQVVSRMKVTLEVNLPLRELFDSPTIAQLAHRISTGQSRAQAVDAIQSLPRKNQAILQRALDDLEREARFPDTDRRGSSQTQEQSPPHA